MAIGIILDIGISSDQKVLGVRSSRCQEVVGVILYVCSRACARPRVRACARLCMCARAPARLPACPPACPRQYGLVCSKSPSEHRFGVVAIDDSGRGVRWLGGPFPCEIESPPRRPASPPPGLPGSPAPRRPASPPPGLPAARPPRRPASPAPRLPAARPPRLPGSPPPGLPGSPAPRQDAKKPTAQMHHGP
jgi:hypothetical protein